MPLPSYARVTNLDNGKSIVVRVNDRGPYVRDRIIDLSIGTAKALDFYGHGLARVRVEYVGRAPLEGSDDRMLMATLREGPPAPAPSRVMVASAKPFIPNVADGPGPPLPSGARTPIAPHRRRACERRHLQQRAEAAAGQSRLRGNCARGGRGDASADASPSPSPPSAGFAPSESGALGLMSGRGLY